IIESNRVWRLMKEVKDQLASTPNGRVRHDALPSTLKYRFYTEFFGFLKNSLFDPRAIDSQAFADFMVTNKGAEIFFQANSPNEHKRHVIQAVLWMFKKYDGVLQREGRIDFDDQKLRALRCLEEAPNTLTLIQRRYDEIIVDEFQDINELDFALIRRI